VSDRDRQLLDVYAERRLGDQRRYYEQRRDEYQRASGQLALVTAALVALGGVAGVLAGADAFGGHDAWAFVAVAAPALATALATYEALFGFEQNAKIFGDALAALRLAELRKPAQPGDPATIRAWVEEVEGILQREQGQWGQLASDAEPAPR
jgi:hypothetical protein